MCSNLLDITANINKLAKQTGIKKRKIFLVITLQKKKKEKKSMPRLNLMLRAAST